MSIREIFSEELSLFQLVVIEPAVQLFLSLLILS